MAATISSSVNFSLSLLKSPSGHGIGLPKKAMADDFGLSNSAVLPCEPVCAHGF
jgi:hypothetical protein